jgi:hypothetical protein
MRLPRLVLLAAACIAAVPFTAQQQQPLVCASSGSTGARGCEGFHYHVALYRPDTKQHVEISATPQYATQTACERARELKMAASAKVTEFFRGIKQQQYEGDRYGPCHCDMTTDTAVRMQQMRLAEEIRLRVRERLMDNKLTTDHDVVRALDVDPPVTPMLGAAKLVPLPQSGPAVVVTAADDLRPTRTIDTTKPAVAALDLPLVDLLAPPAPPPAAPAEGQAARVEGQGETQQAPAAPAPAADASLDPRPSTLDPEAAPQAPPEPITETVVEAPQVQAEQPAATEETPLNEASEEEIRSAEEIAAKFIEYETERITNVLKAASSITDPELNTRIYQACIQRIHLLSNLRLLIEGAGTKSRLANAARDASSEEERLALIAKLFGDEITPHWAPKDAKDVIFDIEENVANAPERVLRDSGFSAAQKKQALYLVLAQTEPTEDQRLWLTSIMEGFLR